MSSTLIDSVKSVFTDVLVTKFATLLGEQESNTRKALHGAIPTVLTWILHKAGNNEEAGKVYNLAKDAATNDFFGYMHELSTGSGGLTAGSALLTKGNGYTNSLLAGRADNVIKEISRYAGISVASASFITGVSAFASLDAIGRHISHENSDVQGMVAWLATQADSIIRAIPAGLAVKDALGIHHYPGERAAARKGSTALIIIIVLIVVAAIIFFIWKSRSSDDAAGAANTADTTAVQTTPAAPADKVTDTLPNGTVLTVDRGSTEDRLISFLGDPSQKVDHTNGNWFTLNKVAFDNNSANLLLESEAQLKNVVAILHAYPKADIKIGGFTDNTGDSVANVRLSQQRADKVLGELKNLGAPGGQLKGAEGYGPKFPAGDNGTEEGRSMNRRVAIDVKGK